MSWSGRGPDGRRGYHHGNLREALIEAALDLIAKKGAAGFTFADAARSAGVSSAAPYRHFRDRDALIADIARRGFNLLAERLEHAWSEGRPDPFTAFENVGRAYLAFARDEPAYYSAMFEAGLSFDDDPALRQAAEHSFGVLRHASELLCARLPPEKRPPALMMSLHAWALSHGIASLFARGDGGRRRLPMAPEELLEAGMLIYLQGLGVIAEPAKPKE
jgi:AcrR family transcriptional regulator